jgi:hypothetical protein
MRYGTKSGADVDVEKWCYMSRFFNNYCMKFAEIEIVKTHLPIYVSTFGKVYAIERSWL